MIWVLVLVGGGARAEPSKDSLCKTPNTRHTHFWNVNQLHLVLESLVR